MLLNHPLIIVQENAHRQRGELQPLLDSVQKHCTRLLDVTVLTWAH